MPRRQITARIAVSKYTQQMLNNEHLYSDGGIYMLVIFYDGQCPLCSREMNALKDFDTKEKLQLEDLHQESFGERFPEIDFKQAMTVLHGKLDGRKIYGLDVTYHAWCLVGKSWRVKFLRWPLIKPVADKLYILFAKHRQKMSRLIVRKNGCENDACYK